VAGARAPPRTGTRDAYCGGDAPSGPPVISASQRPARQTHRPTSSVPGSTDIVHAIPAQLGGRVVHARAWQHSAGWQSPSFAHAGADADADAGADADADADADAEAEADADAGADSFLVHAPSKTTATIAILFTALFTPPSPARPARRTSTRRHS
jgi:hypothetical protein